MFDAACIIVGIIIGAAFTAIVQSRVNDLINPVIGLILGGIDFTSMYVVLSGDVASGTSLELARESGAAIFAYGAFLTACINFLIIAWVVCLLVKGVNRIKDAAVEKGEPVPAAPKGPTQEELLTDIRELLKTRSA